MIELCYLKENEYVKRSLAREMCRLLAIERNSCSKSSEGGIDSMDSKMSSLEQNFNH